MAYFSNGSEHSDWMEENCMRCMNCKMDVDSNYYGFCSLFEIQWEYNGEQAGCHKKDTEKGKLIRAILDKLIPRTDYTDKDGNVFKGMFNGPCSMLLTKDEVGKDDMPPLPQSAFKGKTWGKVTKT